MEQLTFCWKCGVQPVRSLPAPRYPQRPPVEVDVAKIQARRHQVLAAMEGRPGQLRKIRVADEFDAFVLVNQQGVAAGLLLLRTICLTSSAILTRREKAPRWCTKHLVPAWAGWATIRVGKGPCARDGTPPSPSENA